MNLVVLEGRVTKDVEMKSTQKGVPLARTSLAADSGPKDQKRTSFYSLVFYRKNAELASKYLGKGSRLLVSGDIELRTFDGDNGKVTIAEVTVIKMTFLDTKKPDKQEPAPAEPSELLGEDADVSF
jgi:single-strand DNA-binding protein